MRKIILSYKYRKALFLSAFLLFIHLSAHPQSKSIEFVHADRVTNAIVFPNASKAIGNVHFRHGNKDLFCDSAYFHQTNNWVKAYGHVQINQSDTLNLFCDSLHFDGNTNLGILKSNVRFRDNEFKLITDSLEFDATNSIGYYSNWATITSINQDLKLTSRKGYYYSKNKTFFFKDSVKVEDPSYSLTSDTLEFNTISQTVFFHGPTQISLDSTIVHCKKGYYATQDEYLNLWNGATIISDSSSTFYADSLYFNKKTGVAEGFYNVSVYDSIEKVQLKSEYLIKYSNDSKTILKDNARIYQYNKQDTLFLRADTIYQTKDFISNKKINIAINNVIIINSGAVGICDSIYYNEQDSIIKLRTNPILWQNETQLSGDSIDIKLSNKYFKQIFLHNNALVVNKHDSLHYDQLSGKNIVAEFKNNEIYEIFINGNAQTLYYPSDSKQDSSNVTTKNLKGKNYLVCDEIYVYFKASEVSKIKFIDQPDASFYPINKIPNKELYLQDFIWKIEEKPSIIIPK